jgi:hypothetical protein
MACFDTLMRKIYQTAQSPRIYNLSPSEVSCDNYGIGTNTEVIRDR